MSPCRSLSGKNAHTEACNERMASAIAMYRRGLTQQQIAEDLDLGISTIQRYLKGLPGQVAGKKTIKPKPQVFHRRCLCCNARMAVESPYLRMCSTCRGNARGAML